MSYGRFAFATPHFLRTTSCLLPERPPILKVERCESEVLCRALFEMLVFLTSEGVLTTQEYDSAAGSSMIKPSNLASVDWHPKNIVSSGRNCFLSGLWKGSVHPLFLDWTLSLYG